MNILPNIYIAEKETKEETASSHEWDTFCLFLEKLFIHQEPIFVFGIYSAFYIDSFTKEYN